MWIIDSWAFAAGAFFGFALAFLLVVPVAYLIAQIPDENEATDEGEQDE